MKKILLSLFFLFLFGQSLRIKRVAFLPAGSMAAGTYPICVDSDHNGLNEIIFHVSYKWEIWEHFPINQYQLVYVDTGAYPYPPGIETGNFEPKDVGDIDQDGLTDLLGPNVEANADYYNVVTIQESPEYHSYPESLSWWYRYSIYAVQTAPFYFAPDLDQDNQQEFIFVAEGIGRTHIFENRGNNQNELVWSRFQIGAWSFAFGDFDLDGRKEFVTANLGSLGRVSVYENTGNDQYEMVYQDTVRLPNGSDVFSGEDLDCDGKPEFFVGFAQWVGGNIWDFYLYMWEATGNNTYERTFIDRVRDVDWLDQRSKCGDIDGDGIEELVWSIGGQVRIYKATGNNQFQLVWSWRNDHGGNYPHSLVNIYDMNKNGYKEVVVSGWNKTSIFEVEAVKLLRPNGGENFSGNSQELIRWQKFYPPRCDSLSLFFSQDNGRNYEVIATGIPGTDTSYLWQVPNISSDSCKIKIIAYGPGWQYDESDGVFRIRAVGIDELKSEIPFYFTFKIRSNVFKSPTVIHFSLPNKNKGSLKIYNILGKLVKSFFFTPQCSDKNYCLTWDGTDNFNKKLSPGAYFLILTQDETKGYKIIKKIILAE
jgi:hypothetical protein